MILSRQQLKDMYNVKTIVVEVTIEESETLQRLLFEKDWGWTGVRHREITHPQFYDLKYGKYFLYLYSEKRLYHGSEKPSSRQPMITYNVLRQFLGVPMKIDASGNLIY